MYKTENRRPGAGNLKPGAENREQRMGRDLLHCFGYAK